MTKGLEAKNGLLVTQGFEDKLHIGRGLSKWAGLSESGIKDYFALRKAVPLVPKELTIGINERVDWKGSIVCSLNHEEVS